MGLRESGRKMTGRLYGQRERDREREKEKKEREVMGLRDRKVIWTKRERVR